MNTHYDYVVPKEVARENKKRIIGQIWKLLPMWEEGQDWKTHYNNVLVEVAGLSVLFADRPGFLIVLSKLEGLEIVDDYVLYRRTILETLNMLGGLYDE